MDMSTVSSINQTGVGDGFKTPLYLTVLVPVCLLLVFLAGVIGNTLVILVVIRAREMRTSTNIYLANLSVADMLVLLICLPSALLQFHSQEVWRLGDVMCRTVIFLENLVTSASVLTIIAVSVDRYVAVCSPLKAQYTCTTGRAFRSILAVWILSGLATSPFFVISGTEEVVYYDGIDRTICTSPIDTTWKRIFVGTLTILFYCLPIGVLIIVYGLIGKRLYTDTLNANPHDSRSQSVVRTRRQAIIMLAAVIILFFVCMSPIRVVILMTSFCSVETLGKLSLEGYLLLSEVSRLLFYINSAGNPVLYCIISSKYRKAFRRAALLLHRRNSSFRYSSEAVMRRRFTKRTQEDNID